MVPECLKCDCKHGWIGDDCRTYSMFPIKKIIMEVMYDEGCTYNDGDLNPADIKFKVEVTQNKWKTSCVTNWISFVIGQSKYVIEGRALDKKSINTVERLWELWTLSILQVAVIKDIHALF